MDQPELVDNYDPQESGEAQESMPDEVETEEVVDDGETGDESSSAEVESDDEEIDYDGDKFKVPKKLKDAFLRQQDYTQKTQSLAEQRKAVAAQAEQIRQQAELQQQFIADYSEAKAIEKQLAQYKALDWNALMEADPVQAMKIDRQYRELQQHHSEVVGNLAQKQQQQALLMQRENAKRLQEGLEVLKREIKGWSPEMAKNLTDYGQEIGFSAEELANVTNPNAIKLLHKAYQFDQIMKQKTRPQSKPVAQEKPVTRITTNNGRAQKDPSAMNQKEFDAWRKSFIKKR